MLTFIDNTRVTDHLTFPASLQKKQLDAILKAASEIYQLELQVAGEDSHRLVLKGVYLTDEARVCALIVTDEQEQEEKKE